MKTVILLLVFVAAITYIFAHPRRAESRFDFLGSLGGNREVVNDATEPREGEVIEGDIRVSRGLLERAKASRDGRVKRGAVTNPEWKWSTSQAGGKTVVNIPYTTGLSGQSQSELDRAIAEMTDRTCVHFVAKGANDADYINFKSASGSCSSDIGRMGGKQDITISSSGCQYKGKILHEMTHALGFYHEQSRDDRDNYVTYNSNNVKSGFAGQFATKNQDTQGLSYDLHSLMHYRKDQFSSGGNTLEAKSNSNIKLGNSNDFSATDIKRINKLYGCSEVGDGYRDYYVTVTTTSGWTTGTNEFVYIQLIGGSGTSKWCDVATGGSTDDFEAGSVESFFVACNDVGTITQLKVKLVNNPSDWWNDAWSVDKVVIKDKISSSEMKKYVFNANSAGLDAGESVTLSPTTTTVSLESGIW